MVSESTYEMAQETRGRDGERKEKTRLRDGASSRRGLGPRRRRQRAPRRTGCSRPSQRWRGHQKAKSGMRVRYVGLSERCDKCIALSPQLSWWNLQSKESKSCEISGCKTELTCVKSSNNSITAKLIFQAWCHSVCKIFWCDNGNDQPNHWVYRLPVVFNFIKLPSNDIYPPRNVTSRLYD